MGRAINRHGNGGRAAHDRDASCFQPRRGAPVRRQRFLLSRSEFWRLSDDVHQAAKLCRAGPVFSFTLWRDNGTVAVLVSQELLSLLHVGRFGDYLEQGFDQFFKPGPGEHPLQLNPLGRITEEFIRFAEKHPDPGIPYTPIAFLLDPAHGFEMTDYPQWPFEVSQINRSDRALRELFGAAYYPGTVVEGEPASGDRQAFVSGAFGDIFDVIVAAPASTPGSPPG